MRFRRTLLIASLFAVGLTTAGCESMDPSDWFNPKKPLPGERKSVFPTGVPGVPQGVPADLVEGYQPPPEPPPQVAAAPEKPKPKPKAEAKPKPKVAAPQRQSPPASQQPGQAAPWPSPQQTASQPAPSQSQSPFPDPPPRSGTVQR